MNLDRPGTPGIAIAAEENETVVRGRGKSGKAWEVHLCRGCAAEIWKGDLDGNGIPDYVLSGGGPYLQGRNTPLYSLNILLMDAQKLPVPFFTTVYLGEKGNAVKHLVDLDGDGRAELLISTYAEIREGCDGGSSTDHWTTQVYRFRDLYAEEFRGTMGGIRFPFVQDWADGKKPCKTNLPPALEERGTSMKDERTIRRHTSPDETGTLAVDAGGGCTRIHPEAVVYDRPRLRQIAFPNEQTKVVSEIMESIRAASLPVKLRGVQGSDLCFVNLLWAELGPTAPILH
jgi:hypothetical protein